MTIEEEVSDQTLTHGIPHSQYPWADSRTGCKRSQKHRVKQFFFSFYNTMLNIVVCNCDISSNKVSEWQVSLTMGPESPLVPAAPLGPCDFKEWKEKITCEHGNRGKSIVCDKYLLSQSVISFSIDIRPHLMCDSLTRRPGKPATPLSPGSPGMLSP